MKMDDIFYFDTQKKLLEFYAQSQIEYRCICCGQLFDMPHPNTTCHCTNSHYSTIISNHLPISTKSLLGEGDTPLLRSRTIFTHKTDALYFKNEGLNPTGSFKDREAAWLYNQLKKTNINKSIAIVSSGNAAISATLYGKYFDYVCRCYVSETITSEKMEYLKIINPSLHFKQGTYEEIYEAVCDKQHLDEFINITSGQLIDKEYGNIGIIREIYQSGVAPDFIIAPAGNGALIFGLFVGLLEQMLLKTIDKMPRIIAVQIKESPLLKAMLKDECYCETSFVPDSIADAIVAKASYCSHKALMSLWMTKGHVIEVEEEQIRDALDRLMQEGYIVEPSSATVVAALSSLEETLHSSDVVVSILTGSGVKMINTLNSFLRKR